jgi:hypothetical protein
MPVDETRRLIRENLASANGRGAGNRARRRAMKPRLLRTGSMDCRHLTAELDRLKKPYEVIAEPFANSAAVGFGGTALVTYESPHNHCKVWVWEVNGWYAGDAYGSEQFYFDSLPSEEECLFVHRCHRAEMKSKTVRIPSKP